MEEKVFLNMEWEVYYLAFLLDVFRDQHIINCKF